MTTKHYIHEIYDLAVNGFPAKKICIATRRDKGQVSRIINTLVDYGYLICINQGDRVRFYEATKKPLPPEETVILSTIRQKKTKLIDERGSFVRVHAIRFVSTVERMGNVPWDKTWTTKGVYHYFMRYPFLNIGSVGFEWIKGKHSSIVLIHLPSLWWDADKGSPDVFLRSLADKAGSWFMRRYRCDIRGLRQCGKGHFEMPVHDKGLVGLAQSCSVHVGDFVLDSSLGYPEFGSVGGFDPLSELLGLPKRVAALEERVERIESCVEKISVSMERLTKLFDSPVLPDERRDVT